jgi:hypothetical protein
MSGVVDCLVDVGLRKSTPAKTFDDDTDAQSATVSG